MRRLFVTLILILALLGTAAFVWGFFIEPAQLHFRDYKIYVKNWPENLSGFSIAFITDIHTGSPHIGLDKVAAIVAGTNERAPDLILLGGDYMIQEVVGGTPMDSEKTAAVLAALKAPLGVYAVLGNHDWWDDYETVAANLKKHNIEVLEDRALRLESKGGAFWLAGFSDYDEGPRAFPQVLDSITSDEPIIAFTHSPDIFPELPLRVALTLAGHTHGGQVYIPGIGPPIVPSAYGQRYAYGLIEENGKQLFVSPGIGTSILPVRFLAPPEVSMLHIYPQR